MTLDNKLGLTDSLELAKMVMRRRLPKPVYPSLSSNLACQKFTLLHPYSIFLRKKSCKS